MIPATAHSGQAPSKALSMAVLTALFFGLYPSPVTHSAESPPEPAAGYLNEIKPLLKSRCYACHGALKQKAGLRLDTVQWMRHGGKHGDILAPEHALLLQRVTTSDLEERMPPEGEGAPLTSAEAEKLKRWIEAGAPQPAGEHPEADPREHWAYQPPKATRTACWDDLLEARCSQRGLTLQTDVAPELWLRRVQMDLIGLPPTPTEIRTFRIAFPQNPQRAKTAVVDSLLNSPAHGERWGRHFMDLWRYSDWYGLDAELRYSQKHIWHWRDWIIDSINEDKGYDRMILEMIAGDELDPGNPAALKATGYLARNYYIFNRTSWLDEVIEHTGRAFMGTTFQCAKCHDHKYDPIEQKDYYRMRAIFEPYHVRLDLMGDETDFEKDGLPRAYDLHLETPTYVHQRGDEKNPDKSQPMLPGVPEVFGGRFAVKPVALPVSAFAPGTKPEVRHALEAEALKRAVQHRTGQSRATPEEQPLLHKQVEVADAEGRSLRARGAADEARYVRQKPDEQLEMDAAASETELKLHRLELARLQAELALARLQTNTTAKPEALTQLRENLTQAESAERVARHSANFNSTNRTYTPLPGSKVAKVGYDDTTDHGSIFPNQSTGRRLAFARWLTDRNHPLTARVIVNHVWTRHFGAPLVADVTDFGRRSPAPLHQDILDTLAVGLMDNKWSLKWLHRQMVLSRLYARASSNAKAPTFNLTSDPDNEFYWRMNPRRLESQTLRDSILWISGKLDLTPGGPSLDPKNESSTRRSIYYVQTPDSEHRFLSAFDNSNVLECYRRHESIVPQQALALSNSKLSRDSAQALAERLQRLNESEFVHECFLTLLGRPPNAAESKACFASLHQLNSISTTESPVQRARALFVQALMNHNDFITLR